jgi:hypothetical protein
MQLSQQEREIVRICVEELEDTLGSMPSKEADLKVATIAKILRGFIVDKDN